MFRSKMLAFIQSFFMISALFILDACGDDSASSPESLNDHPSESEHIETSSSVLEKSSSSNRTKSSSSINSRTSSSSTISSSSSKIAIDPSTVVAGTLTDTRDGQTYRTVKIGELVWMAENLNYKVEDSYCYNDEDGNCDKYGRLYTWNAAVAACPSGWHLPTSYEYRMLIDAVGGERMAVKTLASTKGWQGDANGSDVYTFTMLPGGFSDSGPSYQGEGEVATFWSIGAPSPTEYIEHIRAVEAGYDDLIFTGAVDFFFVADGDVITDLLVEEDGASVRCVEGELMDYIKFSSSSEEESSSSFESSSSGKYELLVDSRDGQTYRTVKIGTQTWMAENLNYETAFSYCYKDSTSYCTKYGRLYTWAAAVDMPENECGLDKTCWGLTDIVRGVCPIGWHLPDKDEWNSLFTTVGGQSIAGKKLKSNSGWRYYSTNGTNDYGFSALPAGSDTYKYGGDYVEGLAAYFWSSSQGSNSSAYYILLKNNGDDASMHNTYKIYGFSVRCLKDE